LTVDLRPELEAVKADLINAEADLAETGAALISSEAERIKIGYAADDLKAWGIRQQEDAAYNWRKWKGEETAHKATLSRVWLLSWVSGGVVALSALAVALRFGVPPHYALGLALASGTAITLGLRFFK
jgi:hypothetical protein